MTKGQSDTVTAPHRETARPAAFCPLHWAVPGHCGPHLTDGEAGAREAARLPAAIGGQGKGGGVGSEAVWSQETPLEKPRAPQACSRCHGRPCPWKAVPTVLRG